ncbi:MAG: hypothetical protein JNL79_20935 [Myxococcales bacterium]|nr:hypothetical protein [Myxococcales bacterium]
MSARTEEPRRAALVVGVGRYQKLPELAGAPDAARAVGKALADTVFGGVRVVTDPMSPGDVLGPLQKAAHDARDGALFVFFAGFVLERDGALVLAVRETEAITKTPAVPLADVEDVLRRENVKRAIVVLDAEHAGGDVPGKAPFKSGSLYAMGSLRKFDKGLGDEDLVGYAKLVAKVLTDEPARLGKYLEEGLFDARALDRTLALDPMLGHTTIHAVEDPAIVRDLRAPLAALAEEERKAREAEEAKARAEAEAREAAAREEAARAAEARAAKEAEARKQAEEEARKAEEDARKAEDAAKKAEEEAAAKKAEEEAAAKVRVEEPEKEPTKEPASKPAALARPVETALAPPPPNRTPLVVGVVVFILLLIWWLTRK